MPTLDARKLRLLVAQCREALIEANIPDSTIRKWSAGYDAEIRVQGQNYRKLSDAVDRISKSHWTIAELTADSDTEYDEFAERLRDSIHDVPAARLANRSVECTPSLMTVTPAAPTGSPLLRRYCQVWREILADPERHEAWSIAQMRLDRYVWPRLSWEKPSRREGADTTERAPISGEGDEPAQRMISELLRKRRVILYDDAGMGKTAFTHKCFDLLLKPAHWPAWFDNAPPLVVRLEGRWPREKRTSSLSTASIGTLPPPLSIRSMLIDQMTRRSSPSFRSMAGAVSGGEVPTSVDAEVDAALRERRVIVFVDAFDQMTTEDRQYVAGLLGPATVEADDLDPDVRGCAWFLTGRAYAIKPFEKRLPRQTLRLRLERLNDAEQDVYFADLAAHPFFEHRKVKPLDWICRPRENLEEDLGLPLNLREIRTLIEDGLSGLADAGVTSASQDSAWDRRRIATTGELHALVARVLLERALRHVEERRESSGAAAHPGEPRTDDRKLRLLMRVCGLIGLQMMLEENRNASVDIKYQLPGAPASQDGVQAFLERAGR